MLHSLFTFLDKESVAGTLRSKGNGESLKMLNQISDKANVCRYRCNMENLRRVNFINCGRNVTSKKESTQMKIDLQQLAKIAAILARYLRDVTGDQFLSCRVSWARQARCGEAKALGYEFKHHYILVQRIHGDLVTDLFEIWPPSDDVNPDSWQLLYIKVDSGNRWEPPSSDLKLIGYFANLINLFAKLTELIYAERLNDNLSGIDYDIIEIFHGRDAADASAR